MSNQRDRQTGEPSGEVPFSIKEIVLLGLGAAILALLTSPSWAGLAGKLFFGTLSPMMGAVILSIIKAYSSGAAVGRQRVGLLVTLTALWRFGNLSGEMQKSILLAGLRIGLASSVVSVTSVTAVVGVQAGIQAVGGGPIDQPLIDGQYGEPTD